MTIRRVLFWAAQCLFWGWTLSFLSLVAIGVGPEVAVDVFGAVAMGVIPLEIAVFVGLFMAVPVGGAVLGWFWRRDPGRLLSLLYGVTVPGMVICGVRIVGVGQLTPPTALALVSMAVSMATLLWLLARGFDGARHGTLLRLVGATVLLFQSLWGAALMTAIVPALVVAVLQEISFAELWSLRGIGLTDLLGLWFMASSAVLWGLFPVAAVGIGARAWTRAARRVSKREGQATAWAVTAAALLVQLGLWSAVTNHRPHEEAFRLMEASSDAEGRDAVWVHRDGVRLGLIDAYLARSRYLFIERPGEGLEQINTRWFGPTVGAAAGGLVRIAVAPFTYTPRSDSHRQDRVEAAVAYQALFDTPIETAELDVILAAETTTWDWRTAAASRLDIGAEKVWLEAQDVDVVPHGDEATVTIHDVYRNATSTRQEILLSFSLPESAVVSGLWLGTSPDRELADRFVVAPRGAAQAVYEAEVRQSRDPALLEQVGPRQYRLRAFPIPARESSVDSLADLTTYGAPMHLWVEVRVPRVVEDGRGSWPMPVVSEVRNLYWTGSTSRIHGGDHWVPTELPASSEPLEARELTLDGWHVVFAPGAPTPARRRLHVHVDGSASMVDTRAALGRALEVLRPSAVRITCGRPGAVVDCGEVTGETMRLWGRDSVGAQIGRLSGQIDADVLIVLTDGDSDDLDPSGEGTLDLPPLWLVHLDDLPKAYDDTVLDTITATGGGVATSAEEVIDRMADPTSMDGGRWTVTADPTARAAGAPGEARAARQVLRHIARRAHPLATADLDALHAVAVRHEIVSPFSSMIVLVTEAQRENLAHASTADDRFEREGIDADEPEDLGLVATPEPETWMMLGLVGMALLTMRRQQLA